MVFAHTVEAQGMTSLAKMTVEQFNEMKEHQEHSRSGEQFRPEYEDM